MSGFVVVISLVVVFQFNPRSLVPEVTTDVVVVESVTLVFSSFVVVRALTPRTVVVDSFVVVLSAVTAVTPDSLDLEAMPGVVVFTIIVVSSVAVMLSVESNVFSLVFVMFVDFDGRVEPEEASVVAVAVVVIWSDEISVVVILAVLTGAVGFSLSVVNFVVISTSLKSEIATGVVVLVTGVTVSFHVTSVSVTLPEVSVVIVVVSLVVIVSIVASGSLEWEVVSDVIVDAVAIVSFAAISVPVTWTLLCDAVVVVVAWLIVVICGVTSVVLVLSSATGVFVVYSALSNTLVVISV